MENKKRNSIGQFIKEIFAKNWNEDFLFDGLTGRVITYAAFFSMALSYKEKLSKLGIKKNDIICLLLNNSIDVIVLYFTSLIMQLRVVPIDPYKGKNEIKEILSVIDYKIIISNVDELDISHTQIDEIKKVVDVQLKSDIDQLNVFDNIDYDKLFLITFTSGSTGIPKGVMHSFSNLFLNAFSFNKRFNFDKKNLFYHNLPMSYMAGILNLIILPFISESKIVVGERTSISNIVHFWEIPIKYTVNTFWLIPTTIALLLKLDRQERKIEYFDNNKIIGCVGTAPLDAGVKEEFQNKYHITLFESYGLSETLFVSTNFPENDMKNTVGKPLDDVRLSFNEDHEIIIKAPWMFLGYVNLQKEVNKNDYYASGDLGRFDDNGFLVITGRKKDLIIKGGINISPKRIEDFIKQFDIFEENIVMGIKDMYMGEKTVCFFVPKLNFNHDDKKRLNSMIVEKLGKDYNIDDFMEIKQIPKLSIGKINKILLKDIYLSKTHVGEKQLK